MRWQKLIPILLFAVVIVYLIRALPGSFSTDLSRIGSTQVTVVAVHDLNLVASTRMMSTLDRAKDRFDERVLILVADVNTRNGRAFAENHAAPPATLLVFDAAGEKIDTIRGDVDDAEVAERVGHAFATTTSSPVIP